MPKDKWKSDLEEYILQGEPGKAEKSYAWKTAIGLQDVDGLKTSQYLLDTAKEHIEGKIDIATAQRRIESYYESRKERKEDEEGTKEADIVSSRITELLEEKTFQFSPAFLTSIHKRLFKDIFDHAGRFRPYNITKKEWVLNEDTVYYSSCDSIKETLDYDFGQEKQFSYDGLSLKESVRHLAKFCAGIWQIHPFCEGNTRTTAVFMLKYLQTFGFKVDNEIFAENSWYFRNALVRANYTDIQKGVKATTEYLERFFENMLLGAKHELKNRYLHIDYTDQTQSAKSDVSKCQSAIQSAQNEDSKCQSVTLEELAVLREIVKKPVVTQKELAVIIGVSERTIKRRTVALQEKGALKRANGKRNGKWEVMIPLA